MNHFQVAYADVDFVWISDHYDCHLRGLCRHRGELCRFETLPDYDHDGPLVCEVYPLSLPAKAMWLSRKRLFEWCVGYHWTYPRDRWFRWREPKWLFKALFWLYYRPFYVRLWMRRMIG